MISSVAHAGDASELGKHLTTDGSDGLNSYVLSFDRHEIDLPGDCSQYRAQDMVAQYAQAIQKDIVSTLARQGITVTSVEPSLESRGSDNVVGSDGPWTIGLGSLQLRMKTTEGVSLEVEFSSRRLHGELYMKLHPHVDDTYAENGFDIGYNTNSKKTYDSLGRVTSDETTCGVNPDLWAVIVYNPDTRAVVFQTNN